MHAAGAALASSCWRRVQAIKRGISTATTPTNRCSVASGRATAIGQRNGNCEAPLARADGTAPAPRCLRLRTPRLIRAARRVRSKGSIRLTLATAFRPRAFFRPRRTSCARDDGVPKRLDTARGDFFCTKPLRSLSKKRKGAANPRADRRESHPVRSQPNDDRQLARRAHAVPRRARHTDR
jgi:hypothetical protein